MATYLYCFLPIPPETSARDAAALPLGIGGAAVRVLRVGGVLAWVSRGVTGAVPPLVERGEHARVVAAALATGETPLPARVGQRFADDDALRAEVVARMESIMSSLEQLRGRVEMILHLQLTSVAPRTAEQPSTEGDTRPVSGRAYLLRRRDELERVEAKRRTGERLRSLARRHLSGLVERDAVLPVSGTHRYIVPHLIRRDDVHRWRVRASSLTLTGVQRVTLAGPLPPYDFVAHDGLGAPVPDPTGP